ncbi:hypothetical protein BO71DRAFT_428968 [Aspergillus ellipticus CBS 707.79]|uniref:Uncharacterized protein n=1 Tax=Aspergillus ellipticus CBS 707.79 TaxID=1448320 RepID=A0A319DDG1_9EURO|nr:hypothetical protein BO71DRAFT_428968 [Aspergillus ellipticus CBS 707.79]
MFGNGLMAWLRPSSEAAVPESKWDPETLTMQQPASPSRLSAEQVVTDQPRAGESMQLQIRGGVAPVSAASSVASAAATVAVTMDGTALPRAPPDLELSIRL